MGITVIHSSRLALNFILEANIICKESESTAQLAWGPGTAGDR